MIGEKWDWELADPIQVHFQMGGGGTWIGRGKGILVLMVNNPSMRWTSAFVLAPLFPHSPGSYAALTHQNCHGCGRIFILMRLSLDHMVTNTKVQLCKEIIGPIIGMVMGLYLSVVGYDLQPSTKVKGVEVHLCQVLQSPDRQPSLISKRYGFTHLLSASATFVKRFTLHPPRNAQLLSGQNPFAYLSPE